jgi:hypothetical protein
MWWEPTDAQEAALAADVRRFRTWFVERPRRDIQTAWGVGSIWSPEHKALVPFVLVNSEVIGSSIPVFKLLPVRAFEASGLQLPETQLPAYAMAATHPRPTNTVISPSPQVLVERFLAEFVQIREPIVCKRSGKQGSAGVVVWDEANGGLALLTAGHIFPYGEGSEVGELHLPLGRLLKFFATIEDLGIVTHHVAPHGPIAAWDAAVIQLTKIEKPSASLVWQKYERFRSPEKIRVHGAFSKLVSRAVVQGALSDLGSDVMMWKDCWIVAPSGLLRDGDSGAAVFVDRDSSFLGMYVAQSELPGSQLPLVHYVQDAFRLEQEVLRNWKISFRMGG